MDTHGSQLAPPPWQLRGRGLIALFHCSRAFGNRCADAVPGLSGRALGGIGALMLVDYETSDVGPYRELLIVPGRFANPEDKPAPAVTHIWVSTRASVDNGRHHWGLPKQHARFRDEMRADASDATRRVRVHRGGGPAVQLSYRTFGPRLPVTTTLLPRHWRTLDQPFEGQRYRTRLRASGRVRAARIRDVMIPREAGFPDIFGQRHLASLMVARLRLIFPAAQTQSESGRARTAG